MTPAEILAVIAALQSAVKTTTFELKRGTVLYTRKLIGWQDYHVLKETASAALTARDSWLNAATAHQLDWCHDSTSCPICTVSAVKV